MKGIHNPNCRECICWKCAKDCVECCSEHQDDLTCMDDLEEDEAQDCPDFTPETEE